MMIAKKLKSLQALRGIAALLVMFFHYRFYLRGSEGIGDKIWDMLFGWGIIGVDIFFVISGFIMVYTTYHYQHGVAASKRFLVNRAIRIIPLYYFGLLIAFLLGGAMSIFHYPEKVQNFISALTFTVYRTDITPHYIDDGGLYNVRWTLNYEVYFYLVFAVCLILKHRFIALLIWAALATVILPYLSGFSPTLHVQGYPTETPLWGLLSNPIILEFIIGALAGYVYIHLSQKNIPDKIYTVLAAGLILFFVVGIYNGDVQPLNIKSALLIGILVIILACADTSIRRFIPGMLIYIGNLSFSLYLLHIPVGFTIMSRVEPARNYPLHGIPFVILAMVASVICAHFSHKYIEVKLTRRLRHKLLSTTGDTPTILQKGIR